MYKAREERPSLPFLLGRENKQTNKPTQKCMKSTALTLQCRDRASRGWPCAGALRAVGDNVMTSMLKRLFPHSELCSPQWLQKDLPLLGRATDVRVRHGTGSFDLWPHSPFLLNTDSCPSASDLPFF